MGHPVLVPDSPFEGVISLSAVGGAGVEDDLAVQGARLRVPVGRIRQVAHVPAEQIIQE